MRGEINENSIEHYCDPKDLIELPSPGDGQLEKRRSTLYKCRSVEDFASSSSYEVSHRISGMWLRVSEAKLSSYRGSYKGVGIRCFISITPPPPSVKNLYETQCETFL